MAPVHKSSESGARRRENLIYTQGRTHGRSHGLEGHEGREERRRLLEGRVEVDGLPRAARLRAQCIIVVEDRVVAAARQREQIA